MTRGKGYIRGYSVGFYSSPACFSKAAGEINKKALNTESVFGIHEETNRITIKIIDKETKDVKTLDGIGIANHGIDSYEMSPVDICIF